jgi:predicted Zn-dependent peptidase
MKLPKRIGRGLAYGWIGMCVALGCAPSRPPLPPAPPPVSAEQLAPWSHPPPLAPEERAASLDLRIQRAKLPNGVGVTVAITEGAATSVQLWLPNARDRGQGAVTAMVNSLRAGTRDGTQDPFYDPKIALAPIRAWTDAVGTTFYWRVPQRGTQQALSLLGAYVRDPLFDQDEVQLQLQQQLAAIKFASEPLNQLQPLARSAFPGLERPTYEQDARQLFHLPPQKLQRIQRCTMQPANAELVVVGPVAFDSVVAWATSAFGSWRADPAATAEACAEWLTPAFPEHPEQARLDRPLLVVISGLRGDPRIAMDVPGPPIDSPDYHPFELLSMLLEEHAGGSARALRHAGATYGIHSSTYDRYARLSLLEVRGQIDPEQLQGALRSLIDDIHGLASRLDAAELDAAKRRWRTQLIDSWQRGGALAGALLWTLRSGHEPADVLKAFDEVQQIDLARFREVAERYLSPAKPSITITGYAPNLIRGLALGAEVRQVRWTDKLQEHEKLDR